MPINKCADPPARWGRQGQRPAPLRLIALLLTGAGLIACALWLRSSFWVRDYLWQHKDLADLERSVRSQPNDPLGHYYLARNYLFGHRFAEAAAEYDAAVRLDPDSARARLGFALSLFELGKLEQARDQLEHAIQLDPRSARAEFMLGKLDWLRGDVQGALVHVRRATDLDPRDAQAWYAIGVCCSNLHQLDDAMNALRQAVARRPSSAPYQTALGELMANRGDPAEGLQHLQRAMAIDPDYGPACALMGRYYLSNPQQPQAESRAEKLLLHALQRQTYHPEQIYTDLGRLYLKQRRYARAIAALEESIHRNPRDQEPYYLLVRAYRQMGNHKAAADALHRFLHVSDLDLQKQNLQSRLNYAPTDAMARLKLARTYRDLALLPQAAEQYLGYLRLRPQSPEVREEFDEFMHYARPMLNLPRDFALPQLP